MRVSLANILIIVGTLLVVLLVSLLAIRVARWRRDEALRRHSAPVLVVPLEPTPAAAPRPARSREVFAPRSSPASVRRIAIPEADLTPVELEPLDVQYVSGGDTFLQRPTPPGGAPGTAEVDFSPNEGRRIRFVQADDGTLEFLPGRLEVVGGDDIGQEIHFARLVGEENTTVTFGRSDGPPLRHVQLLDATVSRAHATMRHTGAHWLLTNLSQTNPVVLNGAPLPAHGIEVTLQDGDRIEMGAVVFVFRAQ